MPSSLGTSVFHARAWMVPPGRKEREEQRRGSRMRLPDKVLVRLLAEDYVKIMDIFKGISFVIFIDRS